MTAALKIVRRSPRIATLGWYSLLDDPPAPDGLEVARGLMEADGTPQARVLRVPRRLTREEQPLQHAGRRGGG